MMNFAMKHWQTLVVTGLVLIAVGIALVVLG